jgi:hypothetical protein
MTRCVYIISVSLFSVLISIMPSKGMEDVIQQEYEKRLRMVSEITAESYDEIIVNGIKVTEEGGATEQGEDAIIFLSEFMKDIKNTQNPILTGLSSFNLQEAQDATKMLIHHLQIGLLFPHDGNYHKVWNFLLRLQNDLDKIIKTPMDEFFRN